ncbi:MAG: 23S rRNA (uracil(1939)-C(5))-methyltransferase RlmD [Deltaproteobacteria bacterium]|nr:23S rRNA (uracil(1939)-C(5))-methyltransferase RlmD [Deltaproteobacteria bacterium]
MSVRRGDRVEVAVEGMAYGGQGVARLDGFVIFVRGGVKGDRVLAGVFRKKKDHAEARILEILDPSPDRISPPCPHSGYCGGCQWQHIRYERQLDFKREHVRDAVIRIGGLDDATVHRVIPSEEVFGYRNKMEFSFSDRRWLLPEEMENPAGERDFALGLHVPGAFDRVMDIDACLLQKEAGNDILKAAKLYARNSGVPPYGLKSHRGYWRFLALRYSAFFRQWMVNVVTSEYRPEVTGPLVEMLQDRFEGISTVVNNITGRKASIALGEREVVLSGEGTIRDRLGLFTFQISANSFFQTNARGAEALYSKVVEYAGLTGSERVLDLYSGTGTIPIFLSGMAQEVVGMEIMASAVRDAETNCRLNGVENCRFVLGDIRESLLRLGWRPDVLIIDPPRAGMHKDVVAGVNALQAERIVYVSCNPATMARDMSMMSGDYEVAEIQPVDMFPHTYHIEAVARLVRRKIQLTIGYPGI